MKRKKVYIVLVNCIATSRAKPYMAKDMCRKPLFHGLKPPHYQVVEKFYTKFLIINSPQDTSDESFHKLPIVLPDEGHPANWSTCF